MRLFLISQMELAGMVRRHEETGCLIGVVEKLPDSAGQHGGTWAARVPWAAPFRAWLACHVACRLALGHATPQRVAPVAPVAAERAFVAA